MRKNMIGAGLGALIGALPSIMIFYLLGSHIESNGREEVRIVANRAVQIAEAELKWVSAGLAELAGKRVTSCSPAHLEALRLTTFTIAPIKYLGVQDGDGRVLCSQPDLNLPVDVVSREVPATQDNVVLAIVRIGDSQERKIQIRRPGAVNQPSLIAFIPESVLTRSVRQASDASKVLIVMRLGGEKLLDEVGKWGEQADNIVVSTASERYGLSVSATITRSTDLFADDAPVVRVATMGGIGLTLITTLIGAMWPLRNKLNPLTDIEGALARNEFVPYYQPIIDITTGRLYGAEVLIRWRKSDGTIISPARFIPYAESTGEIVPITRALMRNVRDEIGEALGAREHLKISINFSAQHFFDESVVGDVYNIFAGSPIKMSQLVAEVTERQPLQDLAFARQIIEALQAHGVRVAIDDVGTGHSGLSYLLKLGANIIKIDKIFIDAIGTERYSGTIILTLVDLARNMGMDIVAEGIETFDQITRLREHGIRLAQGYVFAPPLPKQGFLDLLAAMDPLAAKPAVALEGDLEFVETQEEASKAEAA